MRTISIISAAAFGTLMAMPAMAQDTRSPFTGPRVEVFAGYDNIQPGNDNSSKAAEGVSYGGVLGYDVQLGGAVLGVEGEVAGSTAKLTGNDIDLVGDSFRLKADRDLYVGARLGFAVAPTTLLYIKGGYTNFRVSSRYDNGTGTVFDQGVKLDGYRIGAGIEQKFSLLGPSGFIKAEYRFSNYNNVSLGNTNVDIDADRHQVLAGVGVRF